MPSICTLICKAVVDYAWQSYLLNGVAVLTHVYRDRRYLIFVNTQNGMHVLGGGGGDNLCWGITVQELHGYWECVRTMSVY